MPGLRLLGESVPRVTGATFSRKYIALGRIVTHWGDIVGAELAAKAQPVKIHYRKPKDKKAKASATLDVAVSSADAAVLHYQKDLILERINRIFGDSWVSDIRFVHMALPERAAKPRNSKKPLTEDEKRSLSQMLEEIDDPAVKERLSRLGTAIMQEEQT